MSMQDPIADLLTQIRNGQMAKKSQIQLPGSKVKASIAKVLVEEGFISKAEAAVENGKPILNITLKYFEGQPVIEKIDRVSRPGLRVYKQCDELNPIKNGLGIAVVSTCKGVITDKNARKNRIGGEVLCTVS